MTEQDRRDLIELDRLAEEAGGYVDPRPNELHYDLRAIAKFCNEKGLSLIHI